MEFMDIYFAEMEEKLNEAIDLMKKYLQLHDPVIVKDLYRIYHTLKGSAGLVGLPKIGEFMHKLESAFKEKLNEDLDEEFIARVIKISTEIINKKNDLTDEEVNYFESILNGEISLKEGTVGNIESEKISVELLEKFYERILKLENNLINKNYTIALKEAKNLRFYTQNLIEENKFISIYNIIKSFENLVFQEAVFNKKKVNLNIEVENTKIEKDDAESLKDVLVHLIKNSIAHGIESPKERKEKGKNEVGNISVKSYIKNDFIYLEVIDDGKGIDLEKVKEKAEKLGYSNVDPLEVIFYSGFSTKDSADQSSGRGVGLDSVKAFAEAKGGFVKLETTKDKGSKFIISFKTKITSKKVLVIKRSDNIFSVDSNDIKEVINKIEVIDGKINYGNKLLDIIDYGNGTIKFAVITKNNRAIIADEIIGHFEAFISPYNFNEIVGFAKNIFSFPIPIISPEKALSKEENIDINKKTVLVLDDSVLTRFVISRMIKNNGYNVIEAETGEEAIKKKGYDVAIVDVELPGINGYEVVKHIKKENKDIPVIMLSTKSSTEDIKKGLDSGANAYVVKGENTEKILNLLNKFLRG
ncbi:response regulator [Marinitoga aeolica]|uniref:histidine kinase n=1 Tax=Marinitoga aeolica TaxID=2809031 RepID=A0ABY8PP36_9BACT|nr:response regulator [Marinitoga aeolica]WGS64397.1 response regulator [Marinitoga aeolica]